MKKPLLTALCLVSLQCILAQSNAAFFTVKDTVTGKLHDGKEILAKEYIAPEKIYEWNIYEPDNDLLLELRTTDKRGRFRNKGALYAIKLDDKSIKWQRDIDYGNSETRYDNDFLLLYHKNRIHRLHPETGNSMWESKNDLYFIEPHLNIGLSYPIGNFSDRMSAIDMNTGAELWKQKLDRSYGWDDVYMYNDSLVLIAVNGIHGFNLHNGGNWHYEANTNRKDIGATIAKNVAGAVIGVLTGVVVYDPELDIATDMVSNIFIDPAGNIIQASRDKIASLTPQGDENWATPLPKNITSKSTLFLIDNTLYMINKGFAKYNGDFSMVGAPYFAAFNLSDGKQLYLNEIEEKRDFIRSFQVINNHLFLIFRNKIATYSLADGSFQKELIIETLDKDEQLEEFFVKDIFVKQNDSLFTDLLHVNPELSYVRTDAYRVFGLNDNLELTETYNKEHIFHKTMEYGPFTFITNDDKTNIVLNENHEPVAELQTTSRMFIHGNKLYTIDKESIRETDLLQLTEDVRF